MTTNYKPTIADDGTPLCSVECEVDEFPYYAFDCDGPCRPAVADMTAELRRLREAAREAVAAWDAWPDDPRGPTSMGAALDALRAEVGRG